jgi:hypothetical protein
MSAMIHSTIAAGAYEVLSDSGVVRDLESLFCTRKRKILFRGSEAQVIQKFPVAGTGCPDLAAGGANGAVQSNMLCTGPLNMELCEGTRRDPHWEVELNWVGIHSHFRQQGQEADFIYKLVYNFSRTETNFPIKVPLESPSGAEFTIGVGPQFVTGGPMNGTTGRFKRVRLINFIPMIQVVGVIRNDGVFPVSPLTPKIKTLITNLNGTSGATGQMAAAVQDWTLGLVDPQYNYCKTFLEPSKQNKANGAFVPSSLSCHRHLSFGAIFAFTMDLTWEQGITP